MKYYDFIKNYLKEEELAAIPNIVKIFDTKEPETEYTSFWVNGTEVENIGKVYLGSEVFDHHLLISLLFTSDAADDTPCVYLGGRRIM